MEKSFIICQWILYFYFPFLLPVPIESLNNPVFVFVENLRPHLHLWFVLPSVNGQNRPACIKSSDQHKQLRITSDVHYISQHKDCITLHYIYTTLHYITLQYITINYNILLYIKLYYLTLHYITLLKITLLYIASYYIT